MLNYARALNGSEDIRFVQGDFMDLEPQTCFDAIIAPPYLRHHDFHYARDIFTAAEPPSSSRTNGPMANFGMSVKRFLPEQGVLDTFIYSPPFDDALNPMRIRPRCL